MNEKQNVFKNCSWLNPSSLLHRPTKRVRSTKSRTSHSPTTLDVSMSATCNHHPPSAPSMLSISCGSALAHVCIFPSVRAFSANRPLDIFKSADDKIDCSSFHLRAFTYCHGMTHMHRQRSRHIHDTNCPDFSASCAQHSACSEEQPKQPKHCDQTCTTKCECLFIFWADMFTLNVTCVQVDGTGCRAWRKWEQHTERDTRAARRGELPSSWNSLNEHLDGHKTMSIWTLESRNHRSRSSRSTSTKCECLWCCMHHFSRDD